MKQTVTVTRLERLARQILLARSDANIDFDDLRRLLHALGFVERMRGGHHVFVKESIAELVNLQPEGRHAKGFKSEKPLGPIRRRIHDGARSIDQISGHACCHARERDAQMTVAERVDNARISWRGTDDG